MQNDEASFTGNKLNIDYDWLSFCRKLLQRIFWWNEIIELVQQEFVVNLKSVCLFVLWFSHPIDFTLCGCIAEEDVQCQVWSSLDERFSRSLNTWGQAISPSQTGYVLNKLCSVIKEPYGPLKSSEAEQEKSATKAALKKKEEVMTHCFLSTEWGVIWAMLWPHFCLSLIISGQSCSLILHLDLKILNCKSKLSGRSMLLKNVLSGGLTCSTCSTSFRLFTTFFVRNATWSHFFLFS